MILSCFLMALGLNCCTAKTVGITQTLQQARVSFKVCQNSLNMFGLTAEELVAGCEIVPAGIVALIELQHNGYAYIKP